jgi:transposase
MTLKRRQFTRDFKLQVIREVEAGKPLVQAAREHQLHPNTIIKWRKLHQQYAQHAFAGNGQTYKRPTRMRRASPNWSAWSGNSRWKMRS